MKIFFSVGEPSGDLHGANLIRQLRRRVDVECVGFGGPKMAAAGCQLHVDLTQFSIMGLSRALSHLHVFYRLYRRAGKYLGEQRPDAVVLIDYPGFNWWVAKAAKRHGIPVFYYGVPQMWAWAPWRVRKLRRLVDHVLCKLPFEADWFRQRDCQATFVGHPYFDELENQELDQEFVAEQKGRPGPLVGILPGSRTQEVVGNLPWFLKAAQKIQERVPDARFAIASFNENQGELARGYADDAGVAADVFVGRTAELIHLSWCCLACSGSVSLELMYQMKPTVVHYWVNRPLMFLRRFVVRVKYITLVNLLAAEDRFDVSDHRAYDPDAPDAERIPMPEYLTCTDKSTQLSKHIIEWLTDENARQQRIDQLSEIRAQIAHGGASSTAAEYIVSQLT